MNKMKQFLLKHGIGNYRSSSESYVAYLRKKGIKVGDNVRIFQSKTVTIDVLRPSLLEIGNNVVMTKGCNILTHGYDWFVLRNIYHEVIASSGKITIEDNVFLGFNVTILKGVTVGRNSIIGAGSVITKDVPPNSVVAGTPGRVICTIEEYYRKRKEDYIDEAKTYAKSIKERFNRMPVPSDFKTEFPLFMKRGELRNDLPIKKQLGDSFEYYLKNHTPVYEDFESFMEDVFGEDSGR